MTRLGPLLFFLLARAAGAQAAGPPLDLVADPAEVTLRADVEARADLRATRNGEPVPGARFVAVPGVVDGDVWRAGGRRAPGYALVAVATPDGGRGAAVLPLHSHADLPTHTSPGAHVTVAVAGVTFGPVVADARGDAPVPVDVPPGARVAVVTSVDREGRSAATTVSLPVKPAPTAVAIVPKELRRGERSTMTVFAIDPEGKWRDLSAPPPVVTIDGAVALAGVPHAVAPGRWDVDVVGRPQGPEAEVRITLDGATFPVVALHIMGPRAGGVVVDWLLGARLGVATAFFDPTSFLGIVDLLCLANGRVGLALEVALAHGLSSSFRDRPVDLHVTQLTIGLAAEARWATRRVTLFTRGGAAMAYATTSGEGRTDSGVTTALFLGGGLLWPFGTGELVVEARWMDARFEAQGVRVGGSALGAVLTAGYHARF